MIRHTAIAQINTLFGIGSEILTVMPQLSAGALAGCGSAPAPQEAPVACACPPASAMGSQVMGWAPSLSLSLLCLEVQRERARESWVNCLVGLGSRPLRGGCPTSASAKHYQSGSLEHLLDT